jgi:hypothetical protein
MSTRAFVAVLLRLLVLLFGESDKEQCRESAVRVVAREFYQSCQHHGASSATLDVLENKLVFMSGISGTATGPRIVQHSYSCAWTDEALSAILLKTTMMMDLRDVIDSVLLSARAMLQTIAE